MLQLLVDLCCFHLCDDDKYWVLPFQAILSSRKSFSTTFDLAKVRQIFERKSALFERSVLGALVDLFSQHEYLLVFQLKAAFKHPWKGLKITNCSSFAQNVSYTTSFLFEKKYCEYFAFSRLILIHITSRCSFTLRDSIRNNRFTEKISKRKKGLAAHKSSSTDQPVHKIFESCVWFVLEILVEWFISNPNI